MQDSIEENLNVIRARIAVACQSVGRSAASVRMLAATKTVGTERINRLPACGVTLAGENRVQEFLQKFDAVKGVEWHFIGALQTNKVKYIIDKVTLIHSLDRAALADEIERQSEKYGVTTDVLIEINAGAEDAKSGVHAEQLDALYRYVQAKPHIRIRGFMPVLPVNARESLYAQMNGIFCAYQREDSGIDTLSMGMSDDYETAVRHGATLIRLGRCIFGDRNKIE